MARARNIKPGFFKNDDLAECSAWARLCFAGLWTLADREGRLEDRPKRIKGELFAFDSIEVEPLLVELAKHGFIARYAAEGRGFIQVVAFLTHQNPHHKEPKSVIPSMQNPGLLPHATPPEPEASPQLHDIKAPDKHEALVPIPAIPSTPNRADSLFSDSGSLIPEKRLRAKPKPKGEGRFPEFWQAWPNTDRKVDRKKCLAKWQSEALDAQSDEILGHIAAMKPTRKWAEGFEPAPLRYLNGEHWLDGVQQVGQADERFAGAI